MLVSYGTIYPIIARPVRELAGHLLEFIEGGNLVFGRDSR